MSKYRAKPDESYDLSDEIRERLKQTKSVRSKEYVAMFCEQQDINTATILNNQIVILKTLDYLVSKAYINAL